MLSESLKWGWRTDNPAKGVKRNPEEARHRYLSPAELAKLTEALASVQDQQGANVIRLLLDRRASGRGVRNALGSTGPRRGGVDQAAAHQEKRMHRVPLSSADANSSLLFAEGREAEAKTSRRKCPRLSFPVTTSESGHREDIKKVWRAACAAAGIVTTETVDGKRVVVPSARVHDLRHTYASLLASAGMSLPIIGALLGHSQPATTARYAHLHDPLRQYERVGVIFCPPAAALKFCQWRPTVNP